MTEASGPAMATRASPPASTGSPAIRATPPNTNSGSLVGTPMALATSAWASSWTSTQAKKATANVPDQQRRRQPGGRRRPQLPAQGHHRQPGEPRHVEPDREDPAQRPATARAPPGLRGRPPTGHSSSRPRPSGPGGGVGVDGGLLGLGADVSGSRHSIMTATSSVITLAAAPSAAPGWGRWTPAGCRVAIPGRSPAAEEVAVVVEEQLVVVDVGVVEGHPQRPRLGLERPRGRRWRCRSHGTGAWWTLGGR